MSDREIIEVTGVDETLAYLDRMSQVVQTTALVVGLNRAGNVIADEVERVTPVRKSNPTDGSNSLDRAILRESVMLTVTIDSRSRGGEAVVSHGKYSYVAGWLEWGHRLLSHGSKSIRKVIGHVQPWPFMRPAAERVKERAIAAFTEGMTEEMIRNNVAEKDAA